VQATRDGTCEGGAGGQCPRGRDAVCEMVEGQPVTEMPAHCVNIPRRRQRVFLDGGLEGPLDMLAVSHTAGQTPRIFLDIPIAEITAVHALYRVHCRAAARVERATNDYLLMAATLDEVKSRLLLPRRQQARRRRRKATPRAELVSRLQNTSVQRRGRRHRRMLDWNGHVGSARRPDIVDRKSGAHRGPAGHYSGTMRWSFQELSAGAQRYVRPSNHVQREPTVRAQRHLTDVLSAFERVRVRGFRAWFKPNEGRSASRWTFVDILE